MRVLTPVIEEPFHSYPLVMTPPEEPKDESKNPPPRYGT
jgi:hypothetical protein